MYSTALCVKQRLRATYKARICRRNIGTGKNCAAVSDGAGGPNCPGSQIGLCCAASESSQNCLTLLSDGSDPAATFATVDQGSQENTPPTCAEVMYDGQTLSPFCCDEMDLPNCPTAAVESMGAPVEQLTDGLSGGQSCVVSDHTACTQCTQVMIIMMEQDVVHAMHLLHVYA